MSYVILLSHQYGGMQRNCKFRELMKRRPKSLRPRVGGRQRTTVVVGGAPFHITHGAQGRDPSVRPGQAYR